MTRKFHLTLPTSLQGYQLSSGQGLSATPKVMIAADPQCQGTRYELIDPESGEDPFIQVGNQISMIQSCSIHEGCEFALVFSSSTYPFIPYYTFHQVLTTGVSPHLSFIAVWCDQNCGVQGHFYQYSHAKRKWICTVGELSYHLSTMPAQPAKALPRVRQVLRGRTVRQVIDDPEPVPEVIHQSKRNTSFTKAAHEAGAILTILFQLGKEKESPVLSLAIQSCGPSSGQIANATTIYSVLSYDETQYDSFRRLVRQENDYSSFYSELIVPVTSGQLCNAGYAIPVMNNVVRQYCM